MLRKTPKHQLLNLSKSIQLTRNLIGPTVLLATAMKEPALETKSFQRTEPVALSMASVRALENGVTAAITMVLAAPVLVSAAKTYARWAIAQRRLF